MKKVIGLLESLTTDSGKNHFRLIRTVLTAVMVFCFFQHTLFAQTDPLFSGNFPIIGWGDFNYLRYGMIHRTDPGPGNDAEPLINFAYGGAVLKLYYPELEDLGLTHVVSIADGVNLLNQTPGYNEVLKILDMAYVVRLHRFNPANGQYTTALYGMAQGNNPRFRPYQMGGTQLSEYSTENHFGFGREGFETNWLQNGNSQSVRDNDIDGYVRKRETPAPAGKMFSLVLPNSHAARGQVLSYGNLGVAYKIMLRGKIPLKTPENPSEEIATVIVWEEASGAEDIFTLTKQNLQIWDYPVFASSADTLMRVTLRAEHFSDSLGQYCTFALPDSFIRSNTASPLHIEVIWHGNRTLSIDYLCMFDNYYDRLFGITVPAVDIAAIIRADKRNHFNAVPENALFEHFYYDEPYPSSYSTFRMMQDSISERINGAVGLPYRYQRETAMDFYNNDPNKPVINLPYILDDYYPYHPDSKSTSDPDTAYNAQAVIDSIVFRGIVTGDSTFGGGLLTAIRHAQNFNNLPGDDVPFIWTVQCQAEHIFDLERTPKLRAPIAGEINIQAYMALCYGAKGLMYYMLVSNTPPNLNNTGLIATYGLFDEISKPYGVDSVSETYVNLIQNPFALQVPNNRYYAVKNLNEKIAK